MLRENIGRCMKDPVLAEYKDRYAYEDSAAQHVNAFDQEQTQHMVRNMRD